MSFWEALGPLTRSTVTTGGNITPAPATAPGSVNAPAAATTDWGSIGGAGIQAAGQTVGMIAQIAGQKAAMDAILGGNALNRASSEKLAMMQLAQNASQFDRTRKGSAYEMLLSALRNNIGNTNAQRDLNRTISRSTMDALGTAFLKR